MYNNWSLFKKWGVTDENDFSTLIQSSTFVCQVLGLISCLKVNGKIQKSKALSAYCIIVTSIYINTSLILLYMIYIKSTCTWMLQDYCFYILVNFLLITNCVFGNSIVKIYQIFTKITTKLPTEKLKKTKKWIQTKDLIVYSLLFVHTSKIFSGDLLFVVWKITGTFSTASIFLLDLQYNNCVFILGTCFKHINEELKKLHKKAIAERSNLLRRVNHSRLNPLLFIKLQFLKQWHYELNELIRKLNSTFSLQLTASVIITFIELTFGLYFYILDKRHKSTKNLDKEYWYFYYYTVVIYFSSKLLLLALTCEFTNTENLKTRCIINEILIHTDDKFFKEEVRTTPIRFFYF